MHKLGYAIAPGEHRQKDVISNSWAIIMFGIRMKHTAQVKLCQPFLPNG